MRQSSEKKKEKSQKKLFGKKKAPWEPSEGVAEGGSQGGATIRQTPVAFAFGSERASRVPARGSGLSVSDSVSFA